MNLLRVALEGATRQIPVYSLLFAFRLFPPAVWGLSRRSVAAANKLVLGLAFVFAFGASIANGTSRALFQTLPWCYAYVVAVAVATRLVCSECGDTKVSPPVAMTLAVTMGIGVPRLLLPTEIMVPFLVVGWDLVFKVYSYCIDCGAPGADRSSPRWLFFFCVDPSLVFATSSPTAAPAARLGTYVFRALAGAVVMFAGAALRSTAFAMRALSRTRDVGAISADAVASDVLIFLAIYALHSGLASLQIGSLGIAGVRVPERYRYPLLARDMPEFWRRWNVYVGQWFARYVFSPVCSMWLRRVPRERAALARGGSVIFTFCCVGIAHTVVYPDSIEHVLYKNAVFLALGFGFCLSVVLTRGAERLQIRPLNYVVGRALLTVFVLSTVWSWV